MALRPGEGGTWEEDVSIYTSSFIVQHVRKTEGRPLGSQRRAATHAGMMISHHIHHDPFSGAGGAVVLLDVC